MFTGLIEDKGKILNIYRKENSSVLEIETKLSGEISVGDSISVNGVCLTAISVTDSSFSSDVMIQTLKLTTLGDLHNGEAVNLELATKASARLGGHLVQGHVDGVGKVILVQPGEKWQKFVVEIPSHLERYIVNQGSIAIDGVSLTVGEINGSELTLWLIPETLAKTNLSKRNLGDKVNIEVDILAKYVERLMQKAGKDEQ